MARGIRCETKPDKISEVTRMGELAQYKMLFLAFFKVFFPAVYTKYIYLGGI